MTSLFSIIGGIQAGRFSGAGRLEEPKPFAPNLATICCRTCVWDDRHDVFTTAKEWDVVEAS